MPAKPVSLPLSTSEFTLHIALTNLPQKGSADFIDKIRNDLFASYREKSQQFLSNGKLDPELFNPLEYYIFGSYDIAFISLVDRFKFSQKLFVPPHQVAKKNTTTPTTNSFGNYDSSAFQVISGVCPLINDEFKPQRFIRSKRKKTASTRFVTICNLKLNNKLLIGNGTKLYDSVVITINEVIKEIFDLDDTSIRNKYFIMQSFSWFEISVVVFTDKLDEQKISASGNGEQKNIKTLIGRLRTLTLSDLEKYTKGKINGGLSHNEIYRNSIYITEDIDSSDYQADCNFLFSDSHSYIGVRRDIVESKTGLYHEEIKTQVEAQLKPGYLKEFKDTIGSILGYKNQPIHNADDDSQFLITGKYDYQFQFNSRNIASNLALIRTLTEKNSDEVESTGNKLGKYTRKLKTTLAFDYTPVAEKKNHSRIEFQDILRKLLIEEIGINIRDIDRDLKRLKVSRLIRGKIAKIFYNYINTIQDSILFIFMLDLVDFVSYLKNFISSMAAQFAENFKPKNKVAAIEFEMVNRIEEKLVTLIDTFQKSYLLRFLNSYQFEDINDFDLDFNSSPQQILSAYNSLAKEVQSFFFPSEKNYSFPKSPVILINFRNTVADAYSINYDVYHLLSPEFIFFTIVKEILNKYREIKTPKDSDERYLLSIKEKSNELAKWISSHKYFNSLRKKGLACQDIDNIFLDYVRMGLMFCFDYKMFFTWSWTYNLQNAAMYDSIGLFNESHFQKELLRLLFVGFLTNNQDIIEKEIKCPLPELQIYWNRYFIVYKEYLEKLFQKNEGGDSYKENPLETFIKAVHTFFDDSLLRKFSNTVKTISGSSIAANELRHVDFFLLCGAKYNESHENDFIIQLIQEGKPIFLDCLDNLSYLQIFQLGYTYLRYIYLENKCEVNFLRRNWDDGQPLKQFIEYNPRKKDFLYNIDQMGGLFFTNNAKAKKYFKMRNSIMLTIWHTGMILKKKHFFIKKQHHGADN